MVTLSRFGRNRRLVLMFEWLTLWPTRTPFPVRSQRRDIALPLELKRRPETPKMAVSMDGEPIVAGGLIVKKTIKFPVRTRAQARFPIIESTYSPTRSGISACLHG